MTNERNLSIGLKKKTRNDVGRGRKTLTLPTFHSRDCVFADESDKNETCENFKIENQVDCE